ncbi:MAG: hypothetical protein ACK40X_11935 [Armatimonadota bacterium]
MRWLTTVLMTITIKASAIAQCALCKSALQSSANTNLISGFRFGILLLMLTPYLIVGAIAFAIYFAYRRSLHLQTERN